MLKADLRRLEQKGRLAIDAALPTDAVLWEHTGIEPAEPLLVRLGLQPAGKDVIVRGTLSGAAQLSCRRCLKDVAIPIEEEVAWFFRHGVSEIEAQTEEVYALPARGEELDLTDAVREHLMLAVPQFALCEEECRGLCPHCGTNLNEEQCGCATNLVDDRWAALKKLRTE